MKTHRMLGLILCLAVLPLFLWACPPVDPLEVQGPYDQYVSAEILIPNPEPNPENPEVPGNPIAAMIYAPSEDGGASIAQVEGGFPLVVFMPGNNARYDRYRNYFLHMASHGYVVVGFDLEIFEDFDRHHDYLARQASNVIDWALEDSEALVGKVDTTRIATSGHSMGGKTAFYAAYLDKRISVVMALDPTNGGVPGCYTFPNECNPYLVAPAPVRGENAIGLLDEVDVASLIFRAEPDLLNPGEEYNAVHYWTGLDGLGSHAVKSPANYFDMGAAGHSSFIYMGDPNVPQIAKRTMVAWLKTHFNGESLPDYLAGGSIVQVDIDAGLIVSAQSR